MNEFLTSELFVNMLYAIGAFVALAILWSWLISSENILISKKVWSIKSGSGLLYYHLPESELAIQSDVKVSFTYDANSNIADVKIVEQKFTISQKTVSDTRHLYLLRYVPSAMHSDTVDLKVSENGLLETSDVSTEDKSAAIVQQLAAAPTAAAPAARPAAAGRGPLAPAGPIITKDYQKIFPIKARNLFGGSELVWKIYIANENGGSHGIADATILAEISADEKQSMIKEEGGYKEFESTNMEQSGIFTRAFKDVGLNLKLKNETSFNTEVSLPIVDFTNAYLIPVVRRSFVKRENNMTFKDGFIQSHKIVNPSSYEGFVSIPINILKAIVAIPAQLVSIKINDSKRQEQATIKLQNEVLKQELEIAKLKVQIESELKKLENP